jgi:hypothetical protein
MNADTLVALKGSIAKWEAIVAGTGHDDGCENCPLCGMFANGYREDDLPGCTGCPVAEAAGTSCCNNTPYDNYDEEDGDPECNREAAVAELAIHQWVDGINKGDMKAATAACADQTSIIADFPPHEWHGALIAKTKHVRAAFR